MRSGWEAGAVREDFSEEPACKDVRIPSCSDRGPGTLAGGDKRRKSRYCENVRLERQMAEDQEKPDPHWPEAISTWPGRAEGGALQRTTFSIFQKGHSCSFEFQMLFQTPSNGGV